MAITIDALLIVRDVFGLPRRSYEQSWPCSA